MGRGRRVRSRRSYDAAMLSLERQTHIASYDTMSSLVPHSCSKTSTTLGSLRKTGSADLAFKSGKLWHSRPGLPHPGFVAACVTREQPPSVVVRL